MAFGQIKCPHCGNEVSQIVRTEGKKRFRKCVKCGKRFPTFEIKQDCYDALKEMQAFARRATALNKVAMRKQKHLGESE